MPDIQEQLPLTEATFFILLSLAQGPQHGYAILKEVEALSDGRVVLSTGTLYGALKRMLDAGWLERLEEPEPGAEGIPADRLRASVAGSGDCPPALAGRHCRAAAGGEAVMRRGNRSLVRSLVALYALLLRLYPAPFRQTFGGEMVAVFRDSLEAAEAAGTGAVLRVAWRELRGFPRNVVAARRSVPVNPGSRLPGWRAWIAWVFLSTLAIPAAWAITFGGIWVAEAVIGQTMMH